MTFHYRDVQETLAKVQLGKHDGFAHLLKNPHGSVHAVQCRVECVD